MADDGLLGGYKVGLISATLNRKSKEKGKSDEKDVESLLFPSRIAQPSFVAVAKKVTT